MNANKPTEIVVPDCCNIGVVCRTLLGVNAAAFIGILAQSPDLRTGLSTFVEASMVIEMASLWSLFAVCGLRRFLERVPAAGAVSLWLQRLACAAIPAAVTGLVIHFFTSISWLMGTFGQMTVLKGVVTGGVMGLALQHYFELRTRAYSPALVEARLQALQARIRPHFLFNSLNAVLSLIRDEPRRAETALEDLADLFRVFMSDPRSMTTLENEIRLCRQYLSIEKIRLGDRLQVQWRAENISDSVLRKAQIPLLLLQPLLENAVHYGVEPSTQPVQIQIHVSRALDRIQIVVVNPYHPNADAGQGNHMALDNIRERLALLYDVEAQLTTTVARGFFEVRLRFPYVKGTG
ncbi:MAG TPA: sensor histidine kinase [Noviherbaspirillum sp.]|nr:sensor histidine kinase [Noviherbaspirillum sp.]